MVYSMVFSLAIVAGNAVIYPFVRKTIEAQVESELQNTTSVVLILSCIQNNTNIQYCHD